jgi:LEA14-like dessication related protein
MTTLRPRTVSPFFIFCLLAGSQCLLVSCSMKPFVYRETRNLTWEMQSLKTVQLQAEIVSFNPNKIGATLTGLELSYSIQGDPIGQSSLSPNLFIKPRSEVVIPVQASLETAALMKQIPRIIGKDSVDIRIMGMARVKKGIFRKRVAVDFTSRQPVSLLSW